MKINRLTAFTRTKPKKTKNIRPDEIQAAVEERNTLSALIQKARVRLDAVQLASLELQPKRCQLPFDPPTTSIPFPEKRSSRVLEGYIQVLCLL